MGIDGDRRKVTWRILLIVGLLVSMFAGSLGTKAQDANQTITLRLVDNLLNMDPAIMTTGVDFSVSTLVYSPMLRRNPETGELYGDLAESWEISEDGLTYTFHLRQGVQWHKGYGELTAADVVYTFERIKNPDTGSRFLADLNPVTSIEAVDNYTVKITTSTPYPAFLDAVIAYRPGFIVNQKAIEELGDGYVNGPIGTGPYMFDSWTPSASVELSANPNYYGTPVSIQHVTFKIIPEDTVAEIALANGEIDAAYFDDPEVQQRLVEDTDFQTLTRPMPRTYFMYLNMHRAPFDNVKVRQAIDHAIDKQAIVDFIFLGQARVANTPLNPNVFGFLDEPATTYDVDLAKQLMTEAGFPDGIDQEFEFIAEPGSSLPAIAEAIQPMLAEIGITVKIVTLERALYEEARESNEYDFLIQTTLRIEPSQILVPYFHSSQAPYPNINGYSGADALIDAARFEPDDAKRLEAYYAAQRQIIQDVPAVSLLYPLQVFASRPGIEGMVIGELTYPVWQMSIAS